MKTPPVPENEAQRQKALDETDLISSGADSRFDRITRLATDLFSVPIALVSLIDRDRQWFKSHQGLEATETPRGISFCGHTILDSAPLVIENALEDERFCDNPLVSAEPDIRFYAGAPLHTANGHRLGTLCLIDRKPRSFGEEDIAKLKDLAGMVEDLIQADAQHRIQSTAMEQHHQALTLLNDIAFASHDKLDEKINHALQEARQYLRADLAIVSQIEEDVYTVAWVDAVAGSSIVAGQPFALKDTWCQLLMSAAGSKKTREQFIAKADSPEFHHHPCYQATPLGSYAGIVIEVDGRPWGTLNLSSSRPRYKDYSDSEKLFLRLLASWLSDLLTHRLSQQRLTKLTALLPGTTYQFRRFPDGRMVFPFSSPQIESLYGLTPAQAAEDATPVFDRTHPDDLEAIIKSIEHSASTLENWQVTYRVNCPGKGYRWVSGQATPEKMIDGSIMWHGYLQDVDKQHQALLALEQSETRLRGLFEFAPIGIALNDFETGHFIDLNDALLAPTGYTREEFIELNYWDVTPKDYETEEQEALASLLRTGRYGPFEEEHIRKDGSRYPVRLQGMLSQEQDGRKVIWSLIEDITERKKLDKMKDQFIATVSHELRTPLTSIKGALGLLSGSAAGELPEKANKLVHTAERNAARLMMLINDLLDMEKLVAGKMPMDRSYQPLGPLLDDAIESVTDYQHQHQIQIKTPKHWPTVTVNVDGTRLIQALTNLLSNAIKFSPEGARVEISATAHRDVVEIGIRDHGPGVTAEFQTRLFQRFSQADSNDNRKLPGTGLGLAITREICQQMDGQAGYRDAEGGGSLFFITLQVAKP